MRELSHRVCRIRLSEETITAVHRRRTGAIIGSVILGVFGCAASAIFSCVVCLRVMEGSFTPDLLLAPMTGFPFIALAVYYIIALGRRWGTVEIDRKGTTVLWRQDGATRGMWTLSDLVGLERRWAFLPTYRVRNLVMPERWMVLVMKDGATVPLFLGNRDELEAVEEYLSRWGLPVH